MYTQTPQAGAVVTVKDMGGNVLGVATSDSAGYYSMAINGEGPYFVKAVLPSGEAFFAVGATDRLNVTALGSAITSIWFQAKGLTMSRVYDSTSSASVLDPYEVEFVAAAIMAAVDLPANVIPPYVSLLEDEVVGGFASFLQQLTLISTGSTSMSVSIGGTTLPINADQVNGTVQFTGFPFLEICPN